MPPGDGVRARRIGFNLLFVEPLATGGMEIYARQLLTALVAERPEAELTGFVSQEVGACGGAGLFPDELQLVPLPVSASTRVRRVGVEQALLPMAARRSGVQILHSLASTGPVAPGVAARVLTIHDLIYRTRPEAHSPLLALGLRVLVPLGARRAHRIIAVSDSTRRDVVELLGVPGQCVDTVPNGPGVDVAVHPTPSAELRARLGLGDARLVLSVGAKRAHKNLARLIEAFAALGPSETAVLVLPGYPTAHEDELRDLARRRGVADRVVFLAWVDDGDLEALYREATLLAFPSLAEGFGLPVLEAMRRGLPVACSRGGALEEVAGDAGLLFDPESVLDIRAALARLLAEPELRADLARRGVARAEEFSWRRTAAATWAVYDRVLSERARSSPSGGRRTLRSRGRGRP